MIKGKQVVNRTGFTRSDKARTPTQTSGDGSETGVTISNTPSADGYVETLVNGEQRILGDNDNRQDCYFTDSVVWGEISGGRGFHTLLTNKTAWAWGDNTSGRLGDNTTNDRSSPVSVVGNHNFVEISAAGRHVLYRKSDGTVWSNGENSTGQLGLDSTTDRSSPVSVVGTHSFIMITAGMNFTETDGMSGGLKADGSAWRWGGNDQGQIGDNTTNSRSSPVSVVGTHSFIYISCIEEIATGLKADGSCWMWGAGADGQLGQGSVTVDRSSPVSVVGAHSFIKVVSGGDTASSGSSIALKADGSVWGWGDNGSGQLGTNNTTDRSSPVSVVGTHSFIDIALGSNGIFVLGLKVDGSVWSWGDGGNGKLGINTTSNRSSPVSVVGGFVFTKIACGFSGAAGITSNGSIWAWGLGTSGELGNNTTTSRSSPVSTISLGSIRSIANIQSGDRLIWNGSRAGFDLDSNDRIDLNYIPS
jgi:alpha-tubulin suppressor-like RCC1 family protein